MTELRVEEAEAGRWNIVIHTPVILGTCSDRSVAVEIISRLASDIAGRPDHQANNTNAGQIGEGAYKPSPTAAPGHEQEARRSEWTASEIEDAICRIVAGEKLSDIAEDTGKRSPLAHHKRAEALQTQPLVTRKASSMTSQEHPAARNTERAICRTCEKEFTMSVESIDRCARCSHGA